MSPPLHIINQPRSENRRGVCEMLVVPMRVWLMQLISLSFYHTREAIAGSRALYPPIRCSKALRDLVIRAINALIRKTIDHTLPLVIKSGLYISTMRR